MASNPPPTAAPPTNPRARLGSTWPATLLCLLAAALVLMLGGRATGAAETVQAVLFLAAALWVIACRPGRRLEVAAPVRALAYCALGFVLVVVFQLLPLPMSVIERLSPVAASAYQAAAGAAAAISIDRAETLDQLLWSLCLFAVFFYIALIPPAAVPADRYRYAGQELFLRTADPATEAIQRWLVRIGIACCVIALGHKFAGAQEYFGLFSVGRTSTRPRFPFTNANQLAQMLELAFAAALTRTLYYQTFVDEFASRNGSFSPEHAGVLTASASKRRTTSLLAAIICLGGLVSTMSRAGIGVTLIGMCAFLGWFLQFRLRPTVVGPLRDEPASAARTDTRKRMRPLKRTERAKLFEKRLSSTMLATGVLLLAVAVVVSFLGESGQDLLSQRIGEGFAHGLDVLRREFFASALAVFFAAPLFGAGFGGWHLAANRFSSDKVAALQLDFAHNDYAQLLAETGAIGVLWAAAALVAALYYLHRAWKAAPSLRERTLLFGSFLAPALVMLHALVDYPFHVPALALLTTLSLGAHLRVVAAALAAATDTELLSK